MKQRKSCFYLWLERLLTFYYFFFIKGIKPDIYNKCWQRNRLIKKSIIKYINKLEIAYAMDAPVSLFEYFQV